MQVLNFTTSVQTEEGEQLILSTLTPVAGIQRVNFNLEDGKRILRVEAKELLLLLLKGF